MKVIYCTETNQVSDYPRIDNDPVVGLDDCYLILDKIESVAPDYDPTTQSISSNWVIDLDSLEYRQEWQVIDLPPVPDWDNFNLTFSTLPSLLQAETIANQNHPSITGKKDDAYAMIDDHGVTAFGYIFPLFCQAGEVLESTRIEWAELAESFNMPADFIVIVRGSTP